MKIKIIQSTEKEEKIDNDEVIFSLEDDDIYSIIQLVKKILKFITSFSNTEILINTKLEQKNNTIIADYIYIYTNYLNSFKKINIKFSFPYKVENKIEILSNSFNKYMHLIEGTSNKINPETFVFNIRKEIKKYSKNEDINIKEFICTPTLFPAIHAVGKGGNMEPRLIVVTFGNKFNKEFDFCLIGKGVTYDSGGYSLKPSDYMVDMHKDMGGAAIAFYISLTSYILHKTKIIFISPIVENLVNQKAYRPGDIIQTQNNKHIQVDNTDAEGRIILADAVEYACNNYKFKNMFIFATLTGAAKIIVGRDYGVFLTDCNIVRKSINISKLKNGERLWELPEDKIFYNAIKFSNNIYSGVKNTGGRYGASSITAALFIKTFFDKKNVSSYTHFDIANFYDSEIIDSQSHTSMNLLSFGVDLLNMIKQNNSNE